MKYLRSTDLRVDIFLLFGHPYISLYILFFLLLLGFSAQCSFKYSRNYQLRASSATCVYRVTVLRIHYVQDIQENFHYEKLLDQSKIKPVFRRMVFLNSSAPRR